MEKELEALKKIIEQQLGWGNSETWQGKDFNELSELIRQKTRVALSESTLRRIMGKSAYPHLPSSTTLDTLAVFAGFNSWREFKRQKKIIRVAAPPVQKKRSARRRLIVYAAIAVFLLLATAAIYWKDNATAYAAYTFGSKSVTRDIPNSVVFNYHVDPREKKPVFIQQSWNPATRTGVSARGTYLTSVYYRPGFYLAKLVVGDRVVKEHPLLLPTKGWLGLIAQAPVPVYLKPAEFVFAGKLAILSPAITGNQVPLGPQPPKAELYNVGNFPPIPAGNFSFSVQVRDGYRNGAGVCQLVNIGLITDGTPVVIPLSAKGCIADINVFNGRDMISGKTADFSGFGTDLSRWVNASCKTTRGKLEYFVNGQLAYSCAAPPPSVHIIGVGFTFQGTGEVRDIRLSSGQQEIFRAF